MKIKDSIIKRITYWCLNHKRNYVTKDAEIEFDYGYYGEVTVKLGRKPLASARGMNADNIPQPFSSFVYYTERRE